MNATTVDPAADLAARWRPTDEQIAEADAELRAGATEVVTLHLLVNKDYAWWTEDVEVIPVPGVFHGRNIALAVLVEAAKAFYAETGRKVTGGYTWHMEPGRWAVFEDVLAVHPGRDECGAGGEHVFENCDESPVGPRSVVRCVECGARPRAGA